MTGWVAIDGGQSAVRVRTSSSDHTFVGGGYSHGPSRVEQLTGAVTTAFGGGLAGVGPVDVVAMGHTGMPSDEFEQHYIAAALASFFGATEIRLAPDMVTAHAGALAGEPGVVISAGTGTVCLGIDSAGAVVRLDGWGYLFGDSGSSYAIGRRAIEIAMRHFDGRANEPALFAAAQGAFGVDLRAATWDLYASASRVDSIAHFAPSVLAIAASGDLTANLIVDDAVRELAMTASSACSGLGDDRPLVSYTGGLFSASDRILRPFAAELARQMPGSQLQAPVGDPLSGAIRLAGRTLGIHAPLVHVYREFS